MLEIDIQTDEQFAGAFDPALVERAAAAVLAGEGVNEPVELSVLITDDAELQAHFAPLAKALSENETTVVEELAKVQGQAVDIGGYYQPDPAKTAAAMRPSATFNAALDTI